MFFAQKVKETGMVSTLVPAGAHITCESGGEIKAAKAPDSRGELGRCRRHAPTVNGFPAVFESDWCGDHKLDENKI